MSPEEKKELQEKTQAGFQEAVRQIQTGEYFLVILDEIFGAIELKLLTVDEVKNALKNRASNTSVVLTGRILPDELKEDMDLITQMQCVKHYFEKGMTSICGIEY